MFSATELEAMLCGSAHIDVDDWERHTVYSELSPKSNTVKWFWRIVRDFSSQVRT